MTIFWVDSDGGIVRATDDSVVNDALTAIKVPPHPAPESGEQTWQGDSWSTAPDRSIGALTRKNINKDRMFGGVVVALAKQLGITEEMLIDEIVAEVEIKGRK